ncbi:protein-(glutamine-N5) methyltransferase, release factor-specific [Rhodoferax sp. TH121]|uniref:peptide chain release factor N(5)-glutamine methyltransferase n=1 Tax=Rhodoferax sp. TH121 TaxID=2022803 RepID=UPI000B97B7EE|nr:peptide chain release factor N(5)-glutamine methyltransferase [Rhodoferax sp. TH121]OYQ39369.1 protein-(glutamine-N5) methyltransferase, release factor-specific [Rhodoferax sp. TH121]
MISNTIDTFLKYGLDRLDAQMLVLHAMDRPPHDRAWLLLHSDTPLHAAAQRWLNQALPRRLAGEPVAYITGHKEFYGLDLQVDARVLVPRPDTETLVDWALDVLTTQPAAHVVDLGTGSGAIALALKHSRPSLQVQAVDYSAEALAVALANAQRLCLEVSFHQGSWMSGIAGPLDAIVSNPPYIREDDEHLPALRHEPRQALTAGADGLDDIRTIITQSRERLRPGGWLLLEHGYDQAPAVRSLLQEAGFLRVQSRNDLAGIPRCSGGIWP